MSDWAGTGTENAGVTTISSSYITTIEDLEDMIGSDPRTAAIALKAATDEAQTWYCQEATRHIDSLPLRGQRYEIIYIENGSQVDANEDGLIQTLEFPRIIDGVTCDWDYATDLPIVPDAVKRACLEEALAIYKMNDAPELDYKAMGIQQLQLGTGAGFQVTFAPGASNVPGLLSIEARRLMRRYVGAVFG